jgi:hypothetical protein
VGQHKFRHRTYLRLIAAALCASLASAGCASTITEGVSTEVAFANTVTEATFRNDTGLQITIQEAYLSLGAVELKPCATTGVGPQRLEAPSGRLGVESELAGQNHAVQLPTRLNRAWLEPLLGLDKPVTVGTLTPPAARYCSVTLEQRAAPRGTLLETSNGTKVTSTLEVRFSVMVEENGNPTARTFVARTTAAVDRNKKIDVDLTQPKRLRLSVQRDVRSLFAGITLSDVLAQDDDALARQMLRSLDRSTTVLLEGAD